jgi:hypothetical protein
LDPGVNVRANDLILFDTLASTAPGVRQIFECRGVDLGLLLAARARSNRFNFHHCEQFAAQMS